MMGHDDRRLLNIGREPIEKAHLLFPDATESAKQKRAFFDPSIERHDQSVADVAREREGAKDLIERRARVMISGNYRRTTAPIDRQDARQLLKLRGSAVSREVPSDHEMLRSRFGSFREGTNQTSASIEGVLKVEIGQMCQANHDPNIRSSESKIP
jgi:hypothetical protein